MLSASELFQQAVALAQAGQREQAREALNRLLLSEPRHELAWLWLTNLTDGTDEQLKTLAPALTHNPTSPRLKERQNQLLRQQQAEHNRLAARAQDHFHNAQVALKEGRPEDALPFLLQSVDMDQRNEQAWLLLAKLVPGLEDQIIALENALTLNPGHATARRQLARLRSLQENSLALGAMYEERGDLHNAQAAYMHAALYPGSEPARAEANQRLEEVQHRIDNPRFKSIAPRTTLLRLTLGPPMVYGLLMAIHAGLNPLYLTPGLCLGGLAVLLGSFLIVLTGLRPKPIFWQNVLGGPGEAREGLARYGLSLTGWVMLLGTLALFAWSAYGRLAAR